MKNVLYRILSVIGVVAVLVCSFVVPAFASGSTSDSSQQIYYSYWNLAKMIVTYQDGTTAIFDMPNTFYITDSYYNETITLTSSNGKTLLLRVYVGSTLLDAPSVSFSFDVKSFSKIQFVFEDSIIRYFPINFGSSSQMPPGYSRVEVVPIIQLPNDTNVISSYSGSYTSVRPLNGSADDDFTFKFYEHSSSFGLTEYVSDYDLLNLYDLVSNIAYQEEVSYYKDFSYNTIDDVPYFKKINVDLVFDFSSVSDSSYYIGLAFPLGAAYNGYSFNPVSEWYSLFFTGYKQFGDGVNVDFTSWISTAVGGFLAFDIIPGISFGLLLTFIIGVAAVNFFLKFFAGG